MNCDVLPNLFIIGMPRSGTKLLRTLLNNHELIYIPDIETGFIPGLIKQFGASKLNESDISRAVKQIKGSIFFFSYSKEHEFHFGRLMLEPGCTIYDILGAFYAELTRSPLTTYRYIGDKTPRNIHNSEKLSAGFPDAKYIHIVRDPRDCALSVNKAWKKNELRAVFQWVKGISAFHDSIVAAKRQFLEVRYEDLLEDPATILKQCTDFLGLDYQQDMVNLSESVENVGDAREPVIKHNNAGKYLNEMTAAHIRRIDDYAVELLRRYGYACNSNRVANKRMSFVMEGALRSLDSVTLLRSNFRRYGFRGGLEKITRSLG